MSAKQRWVPVVIVLLLATVAAGFGWHWYSKGRFVESTDNAYIEASMAVMSARVPGYVEQVLVKENQPVKAGDLLFVINSADYLAQVQAAEAQLAAANARKATLHEQLALQASLIEQARADVRMAEADLERIRKDLQRFTTLDAASASSRQQLDAVQAEERKATAATQSANARVKAQQDQLQVVQAQQEEVAAGIRQAQAQLDLARLNLEHTQVRAPMDGVVGNKHIELGKYLQPGMPVLNVVSYNVYVTANFKETQIEHVLVGQEAELTVDAFPDSPMKGRVASLSPASGARFSLLPPENATGNFSKIVQRIPVRIEFGPDEPMLPRLRPGMSVVVEIDTRNPGTP